MQNTAITLFKVILKAHRQLPITDLSCTISSLWPIIGQIFASDRGVPHFNALTGGGPLRISR